LSAARTIRDNVGQELLNQMSSDVLALLDTSLVVYEKNGDYYTVRFASSPKRLRKALPCSMMFISLPLDSCLYIYLVGSSVPVKFIADLLHQQTLEPSLALTFSS
jgi:hypothetical protein